MKVVLLLALLFVLVVAFSDKDTRKSVSSVTAKPKPSATSIQSAPECKPYELALQLHGPVDRVYPQSCEVSEAGGYRVVDGDFLRDVALGPEPYSLYYVGSYLVKSDIVRGLRYHDVGRWVPSVYKDDLTGKMVYTIRNKAVTGVSKWGKPITLWVRCKDNSTDVFVDFQEYLGDDSHDVYQNWKYVSERLGEGAVKKRKWGISTDKQAVFYRPGGKAYQFAGSLVGHTRYVAEIIPYNENPRTAVFDIAGVDAALKPLRDACGW